MFRRIFLVALLFAVSNIILRAEEESFRDRMIREHEEQIEEDRLDRYYEEIAPKRLNPFNLNATTRTRFGTFSINRMPNQLDFSNSRVPSAGKFGRNKRYLGMDTQDPSFRFKPQEEPGSLNPSEFLGETASNQRERVPSANIPVRPDVAATTGQPRQPTGFFQRPGIMDPPALISGEDLIRTPGEERWFRDIGRRPGLPGLGSPRDTVPDGFGQAFAVGGQEMLQAAEKEQGSVQDSAQSPAQTQVANQVAARRRFERQLEGKLLSDPSVHFLSPVRVSFQNGIATVRGVVPDQQHKVAAGNVLLSDPSVQQVNNHISIVPLDPSQIPDPIEPAE